MTPSNCCGVKTGNFIPPPQGSTLIGSFLDAISFASYKEIITLDNRAA